MPKIFNFSKLFIILLVILFAGCDNNDKVLEEKANEFVSRAVKASSNEEIEVVIRDANRYAQDLENYEDMKKFMEAFKAGAQTYNLGIEIKKIVVPKR